MPAAAVAFHTLIVEDDPSSAEVVSRALRRQGLHADLASSVGEALLRVENEWPHAVILDLRLPDADGTVLLRRLRRDTRTTRIAIVTGVADLSKYTAIMHFPPDIVLQKPVDLPKLMKWIEKARNAYNQSGGVP